MPLHLLPGPVPVGGANERPTMIASKSSLEPQSSDPMPNSRRVYLNGQKCQALKVPFREIALSPSSAPGGRKASNEPVRVYDCSGPWGDSTFQGSVERGLPALRREWILGRGDIEETTPSYRPIAGRSDAP